MRTAGCSWPTFTGGLWHFWGSGLGGSSVNAAESAPRQLASLPNGIASLQGPSEPRAIRARSRPDGTADHDLASSAACRCIIGAALTPSWRIFPDDFSGFAGRTFPIPVSIIARLSLPHTREITDALVSDRRRPRLFPDRSVDRPGAGDRLDGGFHSPRLKGGSSRCCGGLSASGS